MASKKSPSKSSIISLTEGQEPLVLSEARVLTAIEKNNQIELQKEYYDHLLEVGYYPHSGQAVVLKKLFSSKFRPYKTFMQCGRNFGKSTTLAIVKVFLAGTNPNWIAWLVGPDKDHMREVYFEEGRISPIIPPRWWAGEENGGWNENEMRWKFHHRSFIKIFGCHNKKGVKFRGMKPNSVGWDEFQDIPEAAYLANEPNLLAKNAIEIMIGTPPDRRNIYVEKAEEVKAKMEAGDKRFFYIKRTTYDNPRIAKADIDEIRDRLEAEGKSAYFTREYLGEFIPGGASAVLPQFSREKHMHPASKYRLMMQREDARDWDESYVLFDPSGTRFGMAGIVYNRLKGKFWWLWCFISEDPLEITSSRIIHHLTENLLDWPGVFDNAHYIYDEAQKLWALDMEERGLVLLPTEKYSNPKNNNIALARDVLEKDNLMILEHLEDVASDFENYHYSEKTGDVVKKKDEAVDLFLYLLAHVGYSPVERDREEEEKPGPEKHSIESLAAKFLAEELKDMEDVLLESEYLAYVQAELSVLSNIF